MEKEKFDREHKDDAYFMDGGKFDCDKLGDIDQIAGRYADHEEVKSFVRKKCKEGEIRGWTVEKLFAYLDERFKRA